LQLKINIITRLKNAPCGSGTLSIFSAVTATKKLVRIVNSIRLIGSSEKYTQKQIWLIIEDQPSKGKKA